MIKLILGIAAITMIFTLGYSQDAFAEETLLGGDRDEYGCIPSAGYTWSEEKQNCIREWEEQDETDEIPRPGIQLASGVLPEDVICKDDLVKMYRYNGNPICVKESSVQKLVDIDFALEDNDVPDRSKFAVGGIAFRGGDSVADDIIVTEFEDGSIKYEWSNGDTQIIWSDGYIKTVVPDEYSSIETPDGIIQWLLSDGRCLTQFTDGTIVKECDDELHESFSKETYEDNEE